jgi:hypothetical protein
LTANGSYTLNLSEHLRSDSLIRNNSNKNKRDCKRMECAE